MVRRQPERPISNPNCQALKPTCLQSLTGPQPAYCTPISSQPTSRQSQRAQRDLVQHRRQIHSVHGRVVCRPGRVAAAAAKSLEQGLILGSRLLLLRYGACLVVAAVGARGHQQAAALLGALVAGAAHGRAGLAAADALLGGGLDLVRSGAGQHGRERAVGQVGHGAAEVGRCGGGEEGAEEGGDA